MDDGMKEGSGSEAPADKGAAGESAPVAWKARLSKVERGVLITAGAVLVGVALFMLRERVSAQARRDALLTTSAAEAASLSRREAELLDRMRGLMLNEAAAAYPGDVVIPELAAAGALDALLARGGLYIRAAQPDVRPRFLPEAIRSSAKDALVLCLLAPPETMSDYDLTVAATRSPPESPAFDEATKKIQRLDAVQRGLRVLTAGWADEVRAANPIALKALEFEYQQRSASDMKTSKEWAASTYVVIVIDELPAGMSAEEAGTNLAESFRSSLLPAIQKKPHDVRVAILDIESQKPALRARVHVDAAAFGARTGVADPAAAQDCYAGAMARKAAQKP